jgi:hypothetical protein
LLRLVVSLPSTLDSVLTGTVTIFPSMIIFAEPSELTRYTEPRRPPVDDINTLPVAASGDDPESSEDISCAAAAAEARTHATATIHKFFMT